MTIVWILIAVAALAIFWLWATYNTLVRLKNQTQEAWSDIDVQLKRRYDLIPNLVNTVKGYATHEREIFERVTQARAAAMGAQGMADKAKAENMLTDTLKSLFAVAENYPNLKANENFAKLQDELSDTENKIQAARRFYNGNVRDLNTKMETFPTNLIATGFGFKKREFFELTEEAAKNPVEVKF
ncbi:LemA family protein [Candidatus Parcubacteria bacterium]|jgi:LemA protein|nr:MAG: LemA family protein [Candidatus Parcubacteria bacterium]